MSAHAYQRPHSPCPSPSPSAASSLILRDDPPATPSPNSNVPPWIVPGPSSRFNTRERNRPVHTRHKSNYVPQGPVLSTEQRAHQRAQSYAGKGVFSLSSPTPPTSECGRSPLGRMSSYPGESDVSNSMASSTSSYNGPPVTPAKATMHRRGSSIQDSPFSDYFTDDARSLESQSTPTSETQRLLVRLNKLQSQLMRGDNAPEILHVVGRRISEIEADVEALHSHSLIPEEIDEIEEEDEEMFTERERDVLLSSRPGSRRQPQFSNPLGIEEGQGNENNWDKARQDKLLNEAQTALHFLTQAQEQLTQRHQELVNLNEEHSLDMEEKEMEVERLRSENESLKSDLGFDHSELLFLELQLKSLEVECEDSMYQPKLERLQRQMENWRDDWRDVEARFKNRRARYGVTAQGEKIDKDEVAGAEPDENDPKEWKVDIQKQGTRRVNSLTIRRVSKESESEEQERKEWLEKEQPTPTKLCAAEIDSTPKPSRHAQQEEEQAVTKPQPNKTLPTTTYTSQSTQTTPPPSPTLTPVPLSEALGLNGSFNPGLDDCAITTSPSSHADSDEEDEEEDDDDDDNVEEQAKTPVRDARKEARKEQKRTALRELWSGLTDWAGMGDDDEW